MAEKSASTPFPQPALREAGCVRHLRFDRPVVVTMDGQRGEGVIVKP